MQKFIAFLRKLFTVRGLEMLGQWSLFGASTYFSAKLWWTLAGDNLSDKLCFLVVVCAIQAGAITFWILGARSRSWRQTWSLRLLAGICVIFSLLGPVIERTALLTETTKKVEAEAFSTKATERAIAAANTDIEDKRAFKKLLEIRVSAQSKDSDTSSLRKEIKDADAYIEGKRSLISELESDLDRELSSAVDSRSSSISALDRTAGALGMPSSTFSMLLLIIMALLSELVMLAFAWFVNAPPKQKKHLKLQYLVYPTGSHVATKQGSSLCGIETKGAKLADTPIGVVCAKCHGKVLEVLG